MCTKILLEQLETLQWNGGDALVGDQWTLKFFGDPWTKGLAVTLVLKSVERKRARKIVLRRGQEAKLIRNMLQLWVERQVGVESSWIKKVSKDARVGPNVQRFVNAVMSRYRDGGDVVRDRAMASLRNAVRHAQTSGLTEQDLKVAWDEGLFEQMLTS